MFWGQNLAWTGNVVGVTVGDDVGEWFGAGVGWPVAFVFEAAHAKGKMKKQMRAFMLGGKLRALSSCWCKRKLKKQNTKQQKPKR